MERSERIYQLVADDLPTDVRVPKSIESQPVKATPFAGQEDELAAAAQAAVGGVRVRVARAWRRLVSEKVAELGGSVRLIAESVWDSMRSPVSLIVLVGLIAAAVFAEPWAAAGIPLLYAVKLSLDLRALRFHHGPEGVGLTVHKLAAVAPDERVRAELRSLGGAMVRGARLAAQVDRYLSGLDRGQLTHRLRALRESYTFEDDVRRADALARQLGALEDLIELRRTLSRETTHLEGRLPTIREALWEARIDGELAPEVVGEIESFSNRMRGLAAELAEGYGRARSWGAEPATRRRRPMLSGKS